MPPIIDPNETIKLAQIIFNRIDIYLVLYHHKDMFSYFLGVSLPPKAEAVFNQLKQAFHPNHRLTSPAHITLVPPFNWQNQTLLKGRLQKLASQFQPFEAKFEKIGSFKQLKYGTVFLQPDHPEKFKVLARSLQTIFNPSELKRDFFPHLTLAQKVSHQDLKAVKDQLRQMNLKLNLEVDHLALFEFDPQSHTWFLSQKFPFLVL